MFAVLYVLQARARASNATFSIEPDPNERDDFQ